MATKYPKHVETTRVYFRVLQFLHRKSYRFQASTTLMTWISRSSSLSFGASSIKNLARFKVVRYNNIFCCHLLKLSQLNFSSFSPGETEIGIIVGNTGACATVGVVTWADVVGTIVSKLESIYLQKCRACVNFFYS